MRPYRVGMSPGRNGYLYGVAAYLCWGLFPLYWKLLRPSTPVEILAHRIVWSFLFVLALVLVTRGWRRIRRSRGASASEHRTREQKGIGALRQRRTLGLIGIAAVLISVNWGTYIYGVNADRVVETSLGYFINPLVTVLLGVVVLRERLRPAQWAAIGVGAVAVGVLAMDYGHVPVLALVLAVSFGLYGLIKKRLSVPATDGLLLESGMLALPALAFLLLLGTRSESTFGHVSGGHTALLIVSGVVTAVPLLLFAGAANRIPLSAIGLLQYLAPILQLGCGVLIFGEPMPPARLAGFALVWLALTLFTWDGIRYVRVANRAAAVASRNPVPV